MELILTNSITNQDIKENSLVYYNKIESYCIVLDIKNFILDNKKYSSFILLTDKGQLRWMETSNIKESLLFLQ